MLWVSNKVPYTHARRSVWHIIDFQQSLIPVSSFSLFFTYGSQSRVGNPQRSWVIWIRWACPGLGYPKSMSMPSNSYSWGHLITESRTIWFPVVATLVVTLEKACFLLAFRCHHFSPSFFLWVLKHIRRTISSIWSSVFKFAFISSIYSP